MSASRSTSRPLSLSSSRVADAHDTATPVTTISTLMGITHIPAIAAIHSGTAAHLNANLTECLMCGPPRSAGSFANETTYTKTPGNATRNSRYPILTLAAIAAKAFRAQGH